MSGAPRSFIEFQKRFDSDEACAAYLFAARWPDGFRCPACGRAKAWPHRGKRFTFQCASCNRQTSVTSGTVMHGSKLPLALWFWAAYLVASHSNGVSALQLSVGGGSEDAKKAAFLFHLGDIIYKDEDKKNPKREDMQMLFDDQFYETYKNYPREIFAIPGNHDGKIKDDQGRSAIDHFMENFCTPDRHISSDDPSGSPRKTMIQPYPYWVFKTPLAYFVCLYANDINGGQLDDPESDATPQFNWLVDTLNMIRKEDDGRAVLLTIHYPPFSGASNFPERGNPNLGPTSHTRVLKPLAKILQEAFEASKLYPDAVFSAHAHHYQRLTYFCADGRQIPYLIVGSGGHAPIEALAERYDGSFDSPPRLPVLSVAPPGFAFPDGESAQMVQYNDKEHGFMRLTLDLKHRTLIGEYFAAYNAASGSTGVPALRDSFTLDLSKHRIS